MGRILPRVRHRIAGRSCIQTDGRTRAGSERRSKASLRTARRSYSPTMAIRQSSVLELGASTPDRAFASTVVPGLSSLNAGNAAVSRGVAGLGSVTISSGTDTGCAGQPRWPVRHPGLLHPPQEVRRLAAGTAEEVPGRRASSHRVRLGYPAEKVVEGTLGTILEVLGDPPSLSPLSLCVCRRWTQTGGRLSLVVDSLRTKGGLGQLIACADSTSSCGRSSVGMMRVRIR